jgi:branched-chain amino acid transport system substrate-binding protein
MKRRTFLLSGAGALGVAATPLLARAQFTNQFQQPLTIALNLPLSGDGGAAGSQIANGVQAAIDEANRFNSFAKTAFAMRTFDDMDALAQSMVNVDFAASDSTVVAAIGGFDGSLIAASLQSYANAQMPLLVPGSTADAVTARGYRNVLRLPTKDSTEGQLAAEFIARRAKPKLAIAVTQDGDYGPDVAQGFYNQMRSSKTNADVYAFPWQNPDYRAAAAALLGKNPDFIYLCGNTGTLGPLVKALRAAGYKGSFGASQGFYNQATLRDYAAEFEGAIVSTSFPPLERAPDVANALTDFRARAQVTALSAFGYAAAQIIMAAVRRTGATNRLATLSALQSPQRYDTLVGDFQFTFTGDPIDPIVYFYSAGSSGFKFIAPSHATPFVL